MRARGRLAVTSRIRSMDWMAPSGLTVHGAGLFLAGQVVARFARITLGGVSAVESLPEDSPLGGPGGARGGCSPLLWLLFAGPLWRGAAHADCCANSTARTARSTGRLPSVLPAGTRSGKVIPMRCEQRPEPPARTAQAAQLCRSRNILPGEKRDGIQQADRPRLPPAMSRNSQRLASRWPGLSVGRLPPSLPVSARRSIEP